MPVNNKIGVNLKNRCTHDSLDFLQPFLFDLKFQKVREKRISIYFDIEVLGTRIFVYTFVLQNIDGKNVEV
jgi:hypothetical protein